MSITFLGIFSSLIKPKIIIHFTLTTKKSIHYFYLHLKRPHQNSVVEKEEHTSVYNVFHSKLKFLGMLPKDFY